MFCIHCGKEISDNSTFCPECGAAQQEITPPPAANTGNCSTPVNHSAVQKAPYNMMCIIGLVISGISLLLNFWGLVGIVGTIVSVIGLVNCKQKNQNGKALAITGIAIGGFSILYGVISIILL